MSEKATAYVALAAFFALGSTIGVAVAISALDRGKPLPAALLMGGVYGGITAWAIFFAGVRFYSWLRK